MLLIVADVQSFIIASTTTTRLFSTVHVPKLDDETNRRDFHSHQRRRTCRLPTTRSMSSPSRTYETNNTIQGYVNMGLSVDGFIAGPNGELDWLSEQPPPDPILDGRNDFDDFLKSMDCMVMGRRTFDVVVGFGQDMWPYGNLPIKVWTRDPCHVIIPDYLKQKQPFLVLQEQRQATVKNTMTTTTAKEEEDVSSPIANVEARAAPSPNHLFDELQREGFQKVYVDGGMTVRDFLKAGLIARMTLTRVPVLIGNGISLFDRTEFKNKGHQSLKHVSTKVLSNGMVQTVYDVGCEDDAGRSNGHNDINNSMEL